jgi:hypothetical protein
MFFSLGLPGRRALAVIFVPGRTVDSPPGLGKTFRVAASADGPGRHVFRGAATIGAETASEKDAIRQDDWLHRAESLFGSRE